MIKAIRGGWMLVLLAIVLALSVSAVHAADPKPELVYQNPSEGEVIQQSAFGIQLCFASPVNIKDLDKGGDFAFTVTEPDGLGIGNRDVFQPDGLGITVYPGTPLGSTTGQWKFHYRLTSPDAQSALEGDINYTVDPSGTPFPQATPPPCIGAGGTASASPTPGASPTVSFALNTASPIGASPNPTIPGSSAAPTASPAVIGSGGSSHTLTYVVVGAVIAGIAGVLLIAGLVIRRRRSDGPLP